MTGASNATGGASGSLARTLGAGAVRRAATGRNTPSGGPAQQLSEFARARSLHLLGDPGLDVAFLGQLTLERLLELLGRDLVRLQLPAQSADLAVDL